MKFLENLIDIINAYILMAFEKFKGALPPFVFNILDFLKHLPEFLKSKKEFYTQKLRIISLKSIGYFQHYTTIIRGSITALFIYIRSEEFKKDKKKALLINPLNYIKANPLLVGLTSAVAIISIFTFYFVSLNISKIVSGTHKRAPASAIEAEVVAENIFEIKHHNFEVKLKAEGGGGHGGGGAAHPEEETIAGDIKFILTDKKYKEDMEDMEEMIDDHLESIEITISSLPIADNEKLNLEEQIKKEINKAFEMFNKISPIQKVELDFHLHARPEYYRMSERTYSLQNVDFQVFEEDLNRNHQVYIDFTVVASNRNVVLFLKDHEAMIRDRFSTNVEPILPKLPVEDEGKRIIKDKIRDELNDLLRKENIEGKILTVYFDFSISS